MDSINLTNPESEHLPIHFECSQTLQEKIQKIICVIKSGISIYKIDPIGKGKSAKMLLQGKLPTEKKILEMYTNALIFQIVPITLQEPSQQPSSTKPNNDLLYNKQSHLHKIKAIIEASHSGIPNNAIDPIGNGRSIRRLLKGGNCTPQKIDQMYNYLLDYQQRKILEKKKQFIILDPHDNPDNDKKKDLILQAIASGIQKCRIDNSGGKAINRLLEGKDVLQVTLDMMYSNLLSFMGYSQDSPDSLSAPGARQSFSYFQNQISSLQNIVSSLVEDMDILKKAIFVLQKQIGSSQNKNTPHKILGATLMLKDDIIKGKKYRRWYALYLDAHNKRRWIYIGSDVSHAKQKILAWFERYPQDVRSC